ncbi:MAG TPA: CARDB domain-containing protein [Solirubrobacteraceae bacterium]
MTDLTTAIPAIGRIGCAVCVVGIGLAGLLPAASAQTPGGQPFAHSRAVGAQPGGSSATLASATLEQCATAADPTARSATFNGQMSTVPGTRRMAMQIVVQEQTVGDVAFRSLTAAGIGGWRRSEVGVKIYKYVRQVTDLPAPGAYRAIVMFRWLGEKGRVVKRAVRRTAVCVQPDERPKLVVAQVLATPSSGSSQLAEYHVVVRNDGRGAAGPFQVALSVGGVAQPSLTVASLDAGARTMLDTRAPACAAGSQIEVTPDPAHLISEAPGGGQSDTLSCPLSEPGVSTS